MNYTQEDIDEWMERLAIRNEECEQLERERDEARNAIVGWENKWKYAVEIAARAEIERDDALTELDNMQNQRDFAMKVIHRLEKERDELNKFGEEFSALAWKLEGERNEARRELKLALEQSELCIEMSKK